MNKAIKNQQWYIYGKRADFNQLAKEHGITPVTARIMINRGVQPEEFHEYLYGRSEKNNSQKNNSEKNNPEESHRSNLLDMDLAVDIIEDAIATGQKIRVVGDYDIDGVCATTILTKAFKRLGGHVDHDIPDRIKDGYGINDRIIDKAVADGVDFIVTCDNGIAARDAINKAVAQGIAVVITDHHEAPAQLPDADAIVDPKQPGDEYPFKEICGAYVAYKLAELLYRNAGIVSDTSEDNNELRMLKVFASLATVGDVMPLKDENRKLVKSGIKLLGETDNIGLNALIDACQLKRDRISAYTIGFVLGPCINAGGRLESAEIAMELFATEDISRAQALALHLKELNDERKTLTEKFVDVARQQVENDYPKDDVLVLYLPDCHESVAGIIAGRIKEYYHRPTIVLTDTENEPDMVKGSGRSIEAYDMYAKLTEAVMQTANETDEGIKSEVGPESSDESDVLKISNDSHGLLEKFGGHKMAAGMSLKRERINELRHILNSKSELKPEDFIEKIWIDVALPFAYATAQQAAELELLEPFGQGNERPVFAQKNVQVLAAKSLTGYKNFVKLKLKDESGTVCDGIIFADAEETLNGLAKKDRIDILYYPKLDSYGCRTSVQMQIKAWK